MLLNVAGEAPSNNGLITQLIIIVVLIVINAFFASSELAILSANPIKIGMLAEKGNKKAKLVQKLQEDETKFLSTIQVGITLAGFFSSATAAVSLSEGFGEWLSSLNVPFAETIALIVVTLILSYFTLVFGELFPKRIALRSPEKIAMAFSGPVNVIRLIFKPIVFLLSGSCNLLVKLFRLKPNNDEKVTEDEVIALVSTGVDDGTIDKDELELIDAVFTFGDLSVKDVMTPRIDIKMIDINDSLKAIDETIKKERYTRLPVYEDSKDNIIGILNIKDIVLFLDYKHLKKEDIKSILRKPQYVTETMKADNLFKDLKKNKEHSALVIDESGSISGYVTLEDLIEEVMGNIYDEHDEVIEPIEKIDDNTYLVLGNTSIQEINRELDLDIERNEQYNSIAGLIAYHLEYIPEIDEVIDLKDYGISLKIIRKDKNRIVKVELSKIINVN